MSLLSLNDINKSYGATAVLKGVSFVLNPGERAGLIGANGSGKTTLLGIISGLTKPDSGSLASARGIGVGCLAQEAGSGDGVTLIDYMLSARPEVLRLKTRLDASAKEVSRLSATHGGGYESALEEYGRLLEEFESSGGYAYDNVVTGALKGLGFKEDEFKRELSTLSGGQRTRLSLAKLLLAGHDLLMLDEPTNHLDVPAIAWLEGFLKEYAGTVLIVSHDRYFLDKVATRILELVDGKVEQYPGNFSAYRIEKEKRTADRLRQYDLMSQRLEKEKEYINRMRAGVHARQAKGREKRLGSLALPDRPVTDGKAMRMKWSDVTRSSDTVIRAEGISKGFGDSPVLAGVSFTIRRGERIGVVGRNGGGKSTLLKIIMGELEPDSGTVTFGEKVKAAYYAQGLEGLTDTSTVLEELWSAKPMAVEQEIRDMLGVFLFSGDAALKKVKDLSGGEKGRLSIAKVVLTGANLLVLDEPTNHLDIPSREALEEALAAFTGTVLAVSHDRFFLDRLAEKIFEISDGALSLYYGNYTYYSEKRAADALDKEREQAQGRQTWEERKQRHAEEKKREKEVQKKVEKILTIESDIEGLEVRLKETEEKLSDNSIYDNINKVMELTECYNILKAKRDELYDLLEKEVS